MKRRQILITLALAPVAACSQFTTAPNNYSAVAADIDLLVSGLKSLLPYVVSAATAERYNGYVAQVASLAKAIANAQDANSAKSIVQQVLASVDAALSVAGAANLSGIGATVVAAIQVMLPFISTAVGLIGLRTAPSSMSVPQARAVLARRM